MGSLPKPVSRQGGCRILFLDAYDSFSNNIVALLRQTLRDDNVEVYVLHVDLKTPRWDPNEDWTDQDFLRRLRSFDAVVCGPGPGSPSCERDVGAFRRLWELADDELIPVLGICLGFQSLVASCGGEVVRLKRGLHGMVRRIEQRQDDIFRDVPPFRATLYHSLCADIGQHNKVASWDEEEGKWQATAEVPELVPLAWMGSGDSEHENDDDGNERVLMGVRHRSKPFWGLQYHPESICTEGAAHGVLRNWFTEAKAWNAMRNRRIEGWWPAKEVAHGHRVARMDRNGTTSDGQRTPGEKTQCYRYREMPLPPGLDAADVVEILGQADGDAIVLDASSARTRDPLAKNSIIALDVSSASRLEYRAKDRYMTLRRPADEELRLPLNTANEGGDDGAASVWDALTDFWRRRVPDPGVGGFAECSFRGGFMGFVTYEMGLSTIVPFPDASERDHERPDICFAWVERSVVLDHQRGVAYVQCIGEEGEVSGWLDAVVEKLSSSQRWHSSNEGPNSHGMTRPVAARRSNETLLQNVRESTDRLRFSVPQDVEYESKVEQCQEAIRAGESYELCLTDATKMTRPRAPKRSSHADAGSPWSIFRELRHRQPAPFGSYLRLGGVTLISSSPERFLSHDTEGFCSMRPMKGTVRKSDAVSTLAQAEEILHCPKEEAENLMIVDLVRHDLHGVCGSGHVTVPELLKVEEYATVFQMVTNVNAQLPVDRLKRTTADFDSAPFHGLHVLEAALPPGSMTGAPKARSCEILRDLEKRERSLYSGVVGYFDVTGQADWSVTIRSMFRWDDDNDDDDNEEHVDHDREVWQIGAGGAVTILSTPRGETDEMLTKLCGPLGVFSDVA